MDGNAEFYKDLPKVVRELCNVVVFHEKKKNVLGEADEGKTAGVCCLLYNANVSVLICEQELHAHLNGSVSVQTMEKLIRRKPHLNIEHSMTAIGKGQRRTLDE